MHRKHIHPILRISKLDEMQLERIKTISIYNKTRKRKSHMGPIFLVVRIEDKKF